MDARLLRGWVNVNLSRNDWMPVLFAGGRVAAMRRPGRYSVRLSTGTKTKVRLLKVMS